MVDLCIDPARYTLIALLLAAIGCTRAATTPSDPSDTMVTLGFITGLRGTTAPCDCTSNPLGGLARVVTRVEELRQRGPFELFVVGDTFFTHADPPTHRVEQEQRKADVIAEVLGRLRSTVLPGAIDIGHRLDAVRRLAAEHKITLMLPPRTPTTRLRADTTIREIGGLRIGILGIPGAPAGEQMSYAAGAVALRAQGVDFVVGLLGYGGTVGRSFVQQTRAMNAVVGGGSDKPTDPAMVRNTLFVEAGDKGQYLGLLRLHPKPVGAGAKGADDNDWVYDDGGRTTKARLTARIERLRNDVARLTDETARAVRQQKLTDLESQLAEVDDSPPTGSYVTWDLDPITKKIEPAAWVTQRLADYNRSLCAIALRRARDMIDQERLCPDAPTPADTFVGNAACAECHEEAIAFHKTTAHAAAWASLTAAGRECDLGCIGCHSIGYEQPGGYCRLADAERNKNVGCESCHGPGAGHAESPDERGGWGGRFNPSPAADVCKTCHTPEHSDLFDFAGYLPRVIGRGHGERKPVTP